MTSSFLAQSPMLNAAGKMEGGEGSVVEVVELASRARRAVLPIMIWDVLVLIWEMGLRMMERDCMILPYRGLRMWMQASMTALQIVRGLPTHLPSLSFPKSTPFLRTLHPLYASRESQSRSREARETYTSRARTYLRGTRRERTQGREGRTPCCISLLRCFLY